MSSTEEIIRPEIVEPPMTHVVRDTVYDNIQLPLVLYAYRIPGIKNPENYKLEMLSDLLSDGASSRLQKELIDNKKLAVNVSSFVYNLEDPGLFVVYAIANYGVSADQLKSALKKELDKVKTELPEDNEFTKLQNNVETQIVNSNSTMEGIAEDLATYHALYNDTDLINKQLEQYSKITKEDILETAKKYLTDNGRLVLLFLPKNKEQ